MFRQDLQSEGSNLQISSNILDEAITFSITSSSSISNTVSVFNQNTLVGSSSFNVAYDGINYDATTNATILRNSDIGTSLKHKWILNGIGYLNEYATKYNLY